MDAVETVFPFGKNWDDFVRNCLSDERVNISRRRILDFLELPDLAGRYFLDIGCGSGLSSLAALEAGAERVVSFDADPDSVKTTERVKKLKGSPRRWSVMRGSILDREFVSSLEPADIVYSWGVLHHTGKIWEAVENAAGLLKKSGLFYIALYMKTPKSAHWLKVKKRYNGASPPRKRLMEFNYFLRYTFLPEILHGRDPFTYLRGYKGMRGMSYMTDLRDWLGGYPYEDASIEEVLRFCRKGLGLELLNIATGQANTEYLFANRE